LHLSWHVNILLPSPVACELDVLYLSQTKKLNASENFFKKNVLPYFIVECLKQ
jgi:hypothetical protein